MDIIQWKSLRNDENPAMTEPTSKEPALLYVRELIWTNMEIVSPALMKSQQNDQTYLRPPAVRKRRNENGR